VPWGDDRILREILRRGRLDFTDPRVRRIFNRAAVETGLVESGGRNLRYGDADSLGWRQERSSLYPNPLNVRASVRRFAREFGQFYDPGETAGQVAAQVQRPAAQYRGRYQAMLPEAKRVLAQAGAGGLGRGGAGGGRQAAAVRALLGGSDVSSLPGGSGGTLALLQALQGAQGASQAASSGGGLQSPAFSAAPVLPQGAQAMASSGGPQPKQDIGALLDAVRTIGGGMPGVPGSGQRMAGGRQTVAAAGGGGARLGKVTVAPGADRPGVSTSHGVIQFARRVAAIYGHPLRIGTGTNHSRLTVDGNVSDHWSGNAADIPLTGKALLRAGQAALIAAGMPRKQAMRQTGGLFNVNGHQVIFRTTQGGNHWTHLHISL
jgi:hypothetical protein